MSGLRFWRDVVPLAALTGLLGAYVWFDPPAIALLQPDSAGYLAGDPVRGLAYTAFLSWCGALGGDPAAAVPVQLALYFAALGALSVAVAAVAQRRWPGVLCLVFAGANPALTKYAFAILTEAPAMAALMAASAAALMGVLRRRQSWLMLAAIFVALALALRPTSWAFLVPVVLAAFLIGRDLWPRLAAAVLVAAIPLALQAALADPASAAARREFLALNLFGKLALVGDFDGMPLHDRLAARTHPMRAAIAAQPDFAARWILRTAYAEHLRYGVWREFADEYMPEGPGRLAAVTGIAAANPGPYAREVARQFWAFWTLPDAMTASAARALQDGYAGVPELERPPQPKTYPLAVVLALRAVSFGGLALSLAVLSAFAVRAARSPAVEAAAYLALSVHGYALLLALLHSALPRYVLAAWPMLGAMALLAAVAVSGTDRISRSRRRPGMRP